MQTHLDRIETALARIEKIITQQSKDLKYLRSEIKKIVELNTPEPVSVVIDPECGYEWLGVYVRIDADTWSRIKAGEHVKLKGIGWVPGEEGSKPDPNDEMFHWDHWEFKGGIGKPMKVTMESPHEEYMYPEDAIAFEGPLLQRYIHELSNR